MPEYVEKASDMGPQFRVPMTRKRRAAAARRGNQGVASGTVRRHGWRRTSADEQLLEFAGAFGAITLRHAAEYFYGGVWETARKRVQFMREAGLLERSDNLRWAGTVVYPTASGMAAAAAPGLPELRALVPSEERMLHRLLVAEAALRMRARGVRVVAERQMRAVERANDSGQAAETFARFCGVAVAGSPAAGEFGVSVSPTVDGNGRARWFGVPVGMAGELHWPDFTAIVGGRIVAVEMEITHKERWRMLQVLRGYKLSIEAGHVAQVLWEVTPDVQMQLEGRRGADGWDDGLLADLGFLESGQVPDWSVKGRPMVVRAAQGRDEGVRYALSQKTLPPSLRCSYRLWRQWLQVWEQDASALEFEEWLMRPRTMTQLRAMSQ
ncbi:hypothetical protein O4328_28960 [Rhodococcus opacus]|uniref:Uncharacterized protein n=1 Tax=Rhodococcus opacus TaxID=37919 RepID=A0AAX3YPD3_RHOOP|nr:hypothetical protein [Rhodococcus opacus]MCZ4587672.1 hypothetical protein [Rhodococcus opacus]WLF51332.1 hypothetical protein Q5707_38880 [Rhodococcus opacus]